MDARDLRNEKTSVAPPSASLAPASLAPALRAEPIPSAWAAVSLDTAERTTRSPALLTILIVLLGVTDSVMAIRAVWSLALTAALSLLVIPWAVIVLRRDPGSAAGTTVAAIRRIVFHTSNLLLVAAFVAAKWLVFIRAAEATASGYVGSYRTYTTALVVLLVLGLGLRGGRIVRVIAASADRPARLMAGSFGLAATLGALLLSLPISLRDVSRVSFLDSFFMSVSAVCVTGLSIVNVAETYTLTGQVVLVVLMQIGGLGIMVLTAAVTLLAGRRLAVKGAAGLAELVDATSLTELRRTVRIIVLYTIAFEAVGIGVLYAELRRIPESALAVDASGPFAGPGTALKAAVFHGIAAFCNAGLSNFKAGVTGFATTPTVCGVLAALTIVGGFGFPVIDEVIFRSIDRLRRRRAARLTLNTRVVALAALTLLVSVAVVTFALESSRSMAHLGIGHRIVNSFFHSACARTSGFNTVDLGAMHNATLLLTCFAMFVGGAPGSTAGGIKTTTLAVLFAAFRGELRGRPATLLDRRLPEAVVRRAIGVAFLGSAIVLLVVFVLLLTERHQPLSIIFEVVSAFSTTGMSTGITPHLTAFGAMVIAMMMLIGRIGPLTVALALSVDTVRPAHQYPQERVMIG